MNGPHASQVKSNISDEYISQRQMPFVKEPRVFWSKFTEIWYQVPRQIQGRTPSAASTLKMERVLRHPRRVRYNKMVEASTVKTQLII